MEIVKTFNESFPNVTIVLKSYAKDDYIGAINAAYKKDALPPLFESNGLDVSILQKALSAQKAVKTVSSDNVLFFGSYSKVFPDAKQFPLGIYRPGRIHEQNASQ